MLSSFKVCHSFAQRKVEQSGEGFRQLVSLVVVVAGCCIGAIFVYTCSVCKSHYTSFILKCIGISEMCSCIIIENAFAVMEPYCIQRIVLTVLFCSSVVLPLILNWKFGRFFYCEALYNALYNFCWCIQSCCNGALCSCSFQWRMREPNGCVYVNLYALFASKV